MADEVTQNNRQDALEALKKSGFYENLATLENGIDSVLTREFSSDGVELSGGEGQKIAIARASAVSSGFGIFSSARILLVIS